MEKKNTKNTGKSIGKVIGWLLKMTTTVFIVLRACDVIDWPWWKVMMPTFICIGFSLVMLVLGGAALAIAASIEE
jgi:hypothetical protein